MAEQSLALPCSHCGAAYSATETELGHSVDCPRCGKSFVLAAAPAPTPLDSDEQRISELATRLRLLAPENAARAAALPYTAEAPRGARFLAAGLLTQPQLDHLLAALAFKQERVADSRFGTLAVERGWAKPEQITAALDEQKRAFLHEGRSELLGTILIRRKVLTEAQTDALLLLQARARTDETQLGTRVLVPSDHMRATVVLHGGGKPPSAEELRELLVQRGIVHGIDDAALDAIAAGKLGGSGESVIIANGTPPSPPQPGTIEYLFDTHPQKSMREQGEGVVDYRDRGDVPQVASGTVLARATPPAPGTPGTNVLGQLLPALRGKETPLKIGKGVQLAEDKLSALAAVDGRPSLSATGVLSVYPEYEIRGDVDFNTGHINFHGRVVVTGAVRSGFRVRCGELYAGEIENAEVETTGDVLVNGGIIRAHIRAGGNLRARYLHQSRVEVLGDLIVAREIVDSHAEVSGTVESPDCVVMSSRISAMNGVMAREIGSESSTPCHIISGVDEHVQNESARLQGAIDEQTAAATELERRMAVAQTRNEAVAIEIGPLAQLQDRALVRLRELQKAGTARASSTEVAALREQARMAEAQLNPKFAEQEHLRAQLEADQAALTTAEETRAALRDELEQLREWAAARAGRFLVRADLIHQQTLITGPHLEARIESDRKAANLVEREKVERGHTTWSFVST